jgi:hypothetical protein
MFGEERLQLVRQTAKTLRKRCAGVGLQMTVGDVAEAIALGADQAPACGAEPRIEAEQDQPSFSSSSSAMA